MPYKDKTKQIKYNNEYRERNKEHLKEYMKQWRLRPENIERDRMRNQKPERKKYKKKYFEEYRQRPKAIEKEKMRNQVPKRKEYTHKYRKNYQQRPEMKEQDKAYRIKKDFGLTLEEYEARTKQCAICDWTLYVELHHINGRKDNNNLIGLCPNHHTLIHRRHMTIDELKKTV
jgi:flagellar biosynthesis GTPase FlhF